MIAQAGIATPAASFNVVPPLLPGGLEDFVELVVPELLRRGLFRTEYSGRIFRENRGLRTPPNRAGAQRAGAA